MTAQIQLTELQESRLFKIGELLSEKRTLEDRNHVITTKFSSQILPGHESELLMQDKKSVSVRLKEIDHSLKMLREMSRDRLTYVVSRMNFLNKKIEERNEFLLRENLSDDDTLAAWTDKASFLSEINILRQELTKLQA